MRARAPAPAGSALTRRWTPIATRSGPRRVTRTAAASSGRAPPAQRSATTSSTRSALPAVAAWQARLNALEGSASKAAATISATAPSVSGASRRGPAREIAAIASATARPSPGVWGRCATSRAIGRPESRRAR